MSVYTYAILVGGGGFFRVAVSYDTVTNHYETLFTLVQDHGWAWSDLQNMVPFERDVIVMMVKQWIDKKKDPPNSA